MPWRPSTVICYADAERRRSARSRHQSGRKPRARARASPTAMARTAGQSASNPGWLVNTAMSRQPRFLLKPRGPSFALSNVMSILRSKLPAALVLVPLASLLEGCRVVGGIFKAGVWVGVIAVFLVVALLIWIARSVAR